MHNIGFYITSNIYLKELNQKIPYLIYFQTRKKVQVKENKSYFNNFEPDISLTEDTGQVPLTYIYLDMKQCSNQEELLESIFLIDIDVIKIIPELPILYYLNAIKWFPNTNYFINYFEKLVKIEFFNVSSNMLLSYFDPRYSVQFVTKYNNILFASNLRRSILDLNKVSIDKIIDLKCDINDTLSSNLKMSLIKYNKNHCKNIIKHINIPWKFPPLIYLYEFQNIVDCQQGISTDHNIKILNVITKISQLFLHFDFTNTGFEIDYINNKLRNINLGNIVINHFIKDEEHFAILKLVEQMCIYYHKNHNSNISLASRYLLTIYCKNIFNYKYKDPEELKYNSTIDDVNDNEQIIIPFIKKEKNTNDTVENDNLNRTNDYYLYDMSESFR